MVRTQVQFEQKDYELIRRMAHRKKISISEMVRRLVRLGVMSGLEDGQPPRMASLLKVAGVASSGLKDLGRDHDRYLAEEFCE